MSINLFFDGIQDTQPSIARVWVGVARFLTQMAVNQALITVADCGISTLVVIARFTLSAFREGRR